MNAKEAKELIPQKSLQDIYEGIEMMAKSGANYIGYNIIQVPAEVIKVLETDGYKIITTATTISINW